MTTENENIASVGSPSSNYELTLNLTLEARNHPLVGAMLTVENPMGEGTELALGTVTEVTTVNKWHEDPAFRGVLSEGGEIPGMSGDAGDTRQARIRVQAAWRRSNPTEPWKPSGPSMRMSPATGTPAAVITTELVHDLTATNDDLSYMGHIVGTEDIPLPLNISDFSGPMGAQMAGVYGLTGSGKSASVAYLLAGQFRWEDQGYILIDPQGQWSSEKSLPFSIQGFANELGRHVMVRRISEDLRLGKDAPLLTELLKHTRLVVELGLKHEQTQDVVWHEIVKHLRENRDWVSAASENLLRDLLTYLAEDRTANRVYTTPDNAARFQRRVNEVLDDPTLFKDALKQFRPIHNLFQETNAAGGQRHDLTGSLHSVFDREPGRPAPVLILDMSAAAIPGLDDEQTEGAEEALEILESDTVKAAILRSLFKELKRASEKRFRVGRNLNTLIVLDEAWRYAAPPGTQSEDELTELSRDLAGYARDTRKFGIGWLYISQSTRSVNADIWAQMTIRMFGYGLSGGDLDKMAEVVDDRSVLRLYRTFANPRQSGRYPFMLSGPVSPLAANNTPVSLHVYTDFQAFRDDNSHWITPIREQLGLPVLHGNPQPAANPTNSQGNNKRQRGVTDLRAAIVKSSREARNHRSSTGIKNSAGFADPLAELDN